MPIPRTYRVPSQPRPTIVGPFSRPVGALPLAPAIQPIVIRSLPRKERPMREGPYSRIIGYLPVRGPAKTISVGQVIETDTAQPITIELSRLLSPAYGASWENIPRQLSSRIVGYLPLPAGAHNVNVGLVTETDLAQAFTSLKSKAVGQVVESDLSQALKTLKSRSMGQVVETDLSQSLRALKSKAVGQVVEIDTPLGLGRIKSHPVGQVIEIDLAQPIAGAKRVLIGIVQENDLALHITRQGAVVVASRPVKWFLSKAGYY